MHRPVFLEKSTKPLIENDGQLYVDATVGGGGHLRHLIKNLPNSKFIGFDQDLEALDRIKKDFADSIAAGKLILVHENFANIRKILEELGMSQIDGLIADIGVSSFHFDVGNRGFSIKNNGKLDMRMNQANALTAEIVVNRWSLNDLKKIFSEYGDERFAGRIAKVIVMKRENKHIETTHELAACVEGAIPKRDSLKRLSHPATKVFQSIRIAVNQELQALDSLLSAIPEILNVNGVASIISFHSLEDRKVKRHFKQLTDKCICPLEIITCDRCNNPPGKLVYKKPHKCSAEEAQENPRARSAVLRVFCRN